MKELTQIGAGSCLISTVMSKVGKLVLHLACSLSSKTQGGSPRFTARKKTQLSCYYSTLLKLFPLHYSRTNTQLVNAQTTYANLLQFEIESKRLGMKHQHRDFALLDDDQPNSRSGSSLSGGSCSKLFRRKKVRRL